MCVCRLQNNIQPGLTFVLYVHTNEQSLFLSLEQGHAQAITRAPTTNTLTPPPNKPSQDISIQTAGERDARVCVFRVLCNSSAVNYAGVWGEREKARLRNDHHHACLKKKKTEVAMCVRTRRQYTRTQGQKKTCTTHNNASLCVLLLPVGRQTTPPAPAR